MTLICRSSRRVSVLAGLFSINPLSVSDPPRTESGLNRLGYSPHPVLWGVRHLGDRHLVANGDARSLILSAALRFLLSAP